MADKTLQDYYNKSIIVDLDIKKIFGFELEGRKMRTKEELLRICLQGSQYTMRTMSKQP